MRLYEIAREMREVLESMDDYFNEETGEIDTGFMTKLNNLDDDAKHKIEGIGVVCRELKGDIATVKDEIDRLKTRKQSMENRVKWLTDYVSDMMKAMKFEKHTSPNGLFTVYMQKNPDKITVDYPDNLPTKYQKIAPVEPRLKDLRVDMELGAVSDTVIKKAGIMTHTGQKKVRYK